MLDGSLGFRLDDTMRPPPVHGVARLSGLLYSGHSYGDLLELIGPQPADPLSRAAWLMDRSWAYALNYCPYQSGESQREALAINQVFRVRGQASGLRLLALAAPGDLMVNAPLDFIAEPAGLRLDLAYLTPAGNLPAVLPEHDVAGSGGRTENRASALRPASASLTRPTRCRGETPRVRELT